ncbi:F0F1 ATP synthase subunit A [Acanthopleuribacter pedis]|uniref:ATP synthase subunit a n=1 Tax=Acanthopleuribacter pedis TaxID=442870 RepID=A0A8J7QLC8_9BACT|nr:F0F1 ATP synthase subunit A [Acanthopleuribacter pedis]MBO1320095.1 F0F1 ATP synthase subunit A [Acanthopleuribacter pedis]
METHLSGWSYIIKNFVKYDAYHWEHVVSAGVVFIILTILAVIVKSKISLIPNGLQQVIEVVVEGLLQMIDENIGPHGRKYLPLCGALAFFIFVSNFTGMLPGFQPATSNFNTTLGCALVVFVYYNFEGIRENGVGYLKHFTGPIPLLAPIMIPIEIVGHLARPFSLGIRLFGNISGEHVVTLVFYGMVAYVIPAPLMIIGLFAALLQTFVFVMLTTIYLAGAIAHDH